ncbi:MAG TPA: cyclic nucleotide-binding domain-containing protein, partial [Thermodesulfobacteriota bacterium]|nr:cyclic nucleotide-binding domain-containing protein [Thermodesulfobacteriota bacterium]
KRSRVKRGEFVFREGEPAESLVLLEIGTLRLVKRSKTGDEEELIQLGSGAHLGDMAFVDPRPRSATCVAMEDCRITVIPSAPLRSLLEKNPVMAASFYRRLAAGIAQRLRYLNEDFISLKNFLSGKMIRTS